MCISKNNKLISMVSIATKSNFDGINSDQKRGRRSILIPWIDTRRCTGDHDFFGGANRRRNQCSSASRWRLKCLSPWTPDQTTANSPQAINCDDKRGLPSTNGSWRLKEGVSRSARRQQRQEPPDWRLRKLKVVVDSAYGGPQPRQHHQVKKEKKRPWI